MAGPRLPEASRAAILALLFLLGASCAGRKSASSRPIELREVEGKKVALVEVDGGEPTARSVVETALVNQLIQRGTFLLVPKQEVTEARKAPDQDPTDWRGIARRAGADFALKAKILDFTADTQSGYSSEEVVDSQLEAETGNGKTEQLFKVRRIRGHVLVELEFAATSGQREPASGTAEASEEASSGSRTEAAALPPKLRFLEKIANTAFQKFFQKNF